MAFELHWGRHWDSSTAVQYGMFANALYPIMLFVLQGLEGSAGQPGHRQLLKDISENSQEGIDSSQGHSSNSHMSHMAASAFAALSQEGAFQDESATGSQGAVPSQHPPGSSDSAQAQRQPDQDHLGSADSAQAQRQTAEHQQGQAAAPDGATDVNQSKQSAQQPAADSSFAAADNAAAAPLTADSLSKLDTAGRADQGSGPSSAAGAASAGGAGQDPLLLSPRSVGRSSEAQQAGSQAGSQTFDSELHDSISALVRAPVTPGHRQQPEEGPKSASAVPGASQLPGASPKGSSRAAADSTGPASMHTLGNGDDDEEDLTVVGDAGQAKEAQVRSDGTHGS